MKRKIYEIKYEGNVVIKNAFNSAIREIEKIVREYAKSENTNYHLTNSQTFEKDYSGITIGSRQWTSDNGRVIDFIVTKIQ